LRAIFFLFVPTIRSCPRKRGPRTTDLIMALDPRLRGDERCFGCDDSTSVMAGLVPAIPYFAGAAILSGVTSPGPVTTIVPFRKCTSISARIAAKTSNRERARSPDWAVNNEHGSVIGQTRGLEPGFGVPVAARVFAAFDDIPQRERFDQHRKS